MKTSPEAMSVACFTVVVAILAGGWRGISLLAVGLTGGVMPAGGYAVLGLISAGAVALPTIGVALLARGAAAATPTPWARQLGEATVLLAGLVFLLSIAYGLLSVLNGNYAVLRY